jgi:hypothetical protein
VHAGGVRLDEGGVASVFSKDSAANLSCDPLARARTVLLPALYLQPGLGVLSTEGVVGRVHVVVEFRTKA